MRYGIFSDIHSNLEAFEAVLEAMKGDKLDVYICGGDIVGYGADPSGCIELAKKTTEKVVCGNHDWASVAMIELSYFSPRAKEAVMWTAKRLNEKERQYLMSLKTVHEEKNFEVVHGSLDEPERFRYILDLYNALQNFRLMRKNICFIGHSHAPVIFIRRGDDITYTRLPKIEIDMNASYIINVGSVGQPRDGDPRASYAVYDEDKNYVEIKRVPYDIKKAQDKILAAGLPPVLAERLSLGK